MSAIGWNLVGLMMCSIVSDLIYLLYEYKILNFILNFNIRV